MIEELQSTNSELQTINVQLRSRTEELNRTNTLLATILGSLGSGTIAVDRTLNVVIWNRRAEDMWGLRSDETIGQPFVSLDIGRSRSSSSPCALASSEPPARGRWRWMPRIGAAVGRAAA